LEESQVNNPRLLAGLLIGAALFVAWNGVNDPAKTPPAPPVCPGPNCPVPPPAPPAPPKPKPSPWGPRWAPVGASVGGPKHQDGTEIACDLPGDRHRKNTASKGLGNCVFTSIHHSADWQNIPALLEFPRWLIDKGIPGGGHPGKVDQLIPQIAKERGLPVPEYVQVEGKDLEILKAACRTGRMPGVTYSFSPTGRYGGAKIAHMVTLVHADDKHFVVLDNNYPGADKYEWLTPDEFLKTYAAGGNGWAFIPLAPPPPPPPLN
jgi:hypothetical protein